MSLKTFNVDVAIAEALYQLETRENRITRSQLRLPSNWKVLGRTIGSPPPELSDEYPDLPLVPEDQHHSDEPGLHKEDNNQSSHSPVQQRSCHQVRAGQSGQVYPEVYVHGRPFF